LNVLAAISLKVLDILLKGSFPVNKYQEIKQETVKNKSNFKPCCWGKGTAKIV
jgi:hypothetical protein